MRITNENLVGASLFGLVAIFVVLLHFFYLHENTSPQHWDPSLHLSYSMRAAKTISDYGLAGVWAVGATQYVLYPPAFYLSTAPAFLLFGYAIDVGIAWQVVYLLGTLACIYVLVARYVSAPWGALAAFVYSCFPVALGLSRMVYLENLLAFQVALFAALIMSPGALIRPKSAFVLGMVLGWGQLTKWQFLFFVGPLILLRAIPHIRESIRTRSLPDRWTRLIIPALALAIPAVIIAGPWYFIHFQKIYDDVYENAYTVVFDNAPIYELSSILYYLHAFPAELIGLPLSALLLSTIVWIALKRTRVRPQWILVASFVLSIAVFSLVRHKQGRFIVPLLPVLTTTLVVALVNMPRPARAIMLPILILFSCVNCYTQTIDSSSSIPEISVPIGLSRRGYVVRFGTPEWILLPIQRDNWQLESIMAEIKEVSERDGVEPTVYFFRDKSHPYYNPLTIRSHILASGFKRPSKTSRANFWFGRLENQKAYPQHGEVRGNRRLFLLRTWELPDGSRTRLYRATLFQAQ